MNHFVEVNKIGLESFFVASGKSKLVKIDHFKRRYIWNRNTEMKSLE